MDGWKVFLGYFTGCFHLLFSYLMHTSVKKFGNRGSAEVSGGLVRRRRHRGATADRSSSRMNGGREGGQRGQRGTWKELEEREGGRGGGGITAEAVH